MKKFSRWSAVILALVIVIGTSTVFVDHKLKASETNGDTTAQQQQEVAEGNKEPVEVILPLHTEAEPNVEAEPIIEEEPVVEAEPIIEEEPVVEVEPIIEEEPNVEAESIIEEEPNVEVESIIEEEIPEVVYETISVADISLKAPFYTYGEGESLTAELSIKVNNVKDVVLNKFFVVITKQNSTESTSTEVVRDMVVMEDGEIPFYYNIEFVPFDGENTTACLKVVIMDTDSIDSTNKEGKVLGSGMVTFEKKVNESINKEPIRNIDVSVVEEELAVEQKEVTLVATYENYAVDEIEIPEIEDMIYMDTIENDEENKRYIEMYVWYDGYKEGKPLEFGQTLNIAAVLYGYDQFSNITYQWQISKDGFEFTNIEDETGRALSVIILEENANDFYRVTVVAE